MPKIPGTRLYPKTEINRRQIWELLHLKIATFSLVSNRKTHFKVPKTRQTTLQNAPKEPNYLHLDVEKEKPKIQDQNRPKILKNRRHLSLAGTAKSGTLFHRFSAAFSAQISPKKNRKKGVRKPQIIPKSCQTSKGQNTLFQDRLMARQL